MNARDDSNLPRLTGEEARDALGQPWPIVPARSFVGTDGTVKKETTRKWKHLQGVAADDSYRLYSAALWAVVTGAGSGIVVLDADTDEALGGLTPHVGTGRGVGGHLYVRHPGWRVKTQAGVLPGLDVRGDGGVAYFAGASLKGPYRVLRDIRPYEVGDLPQHMAEAAGLLEPPAERNIQVNSPGSWDGDGLGTRNAVEWLQSRSEAVSGAPDGTWNQTFHRAVYGAAGLVAAGQLDGGYARSLLLGACEDPDEAEAVFDSSWQAGLDAPWSAEPVLPTFDPSEYGVTNIRVNSHGSDDDWTPLAHPLAIRRNRDGKQWRAPGPVQEFVDAWTMGRDDLAAIPEPTWLVSGRLQTHCLAQLAGPSKVGKSILALQWALDMTSDRDMGPMHLPGTKRVLYFAAEGVYGLKARIAAWEADTGRTWDDSRLRVRGDVPNLLDIRSMGQYLSLVRGTGPWDLVVIDTLSRAIPGADENDQETMSAVIASAEALKDAAGGALLLVHHFGWEASRQRGSSVLYAGCDNVVYLKPAACEAVDGLIAKAKVSTDKLKDGDPRHSETLDLVKVGPSVVFRSGQVNSPEQPAEDPIIAHMRQHGPLTQALAAQAANIAPRTAGERLSKMIAAGAVQRRKVGRTWEYSLT